MKNMRDIMLLMEAPVVDVAPEEMKGNIDARGLMMLLPDVQDQQRFINAIRKIIRNDLDSISRQEAMQLAYAFVSILRAEPQDMMKIATKMRQVRVQDTGEDDQ